MIRGIVGELCNVCGEREWEGVKEGNREIWDDIRISQAVNGCALDTNMEQGLRREKRSN